MPLNISSILSKVKSHPISGCSNLLGMWVGPEICVFSEFVFSEKDPVSCKWFEVLLFNTYEDLVLQLSSITKTHWLHNRAVSVALSTPDIFQTSSFNVDVSLEKQNILPPGIDWDLIEHAYTLYPKPLFSCIRNTDIENWNHLLRQAGLIPANIIPAGRLWDRFFSESDIIESELPVGIIVKSSESVYYKPFKEQISINNGSGSLPKYNAVKKAEYNWCESRALPALEPVLSALDEPGFNLNNMVYEANESVRIEKLIWKIIRYLGMGTITIISVLLILSLLISGLKLVSGSKREAKESILNEITALSKELQNQSDEIVIYKDLLSKKSNISQVLYNITGLSADSLWLSEMRITPENGYDVLIIGHSLIENDISRFLEAAEANSMTKNVRLEYTERLSPNQVARLTGWKRKRVLYRFKTNLEFVKKIKE